MNSYTYLIGWTQLNLWYYGVRYAKNCSPKDLWTSYRTSSKHVHEITNNFGDPDVIQIRKVFNQVTKARNWEHKVLRRLKVINNNKWINKTNNISIEPMFGENNPATRLEVREKISKNTPKKVGDDNPMKKLSVSTKVSKKLKGRHNFWQDGENNWMKKTDMKKLFSENQTGNKNSFYNKKHSANSIAKMKEKSTCPHCMKCGGKSIMKRWHFDNCRSREKIAGVVT